jgi:hypothetical protein
MAPWVLVERVERFHKTEIANLPHSDMWTDMGLPEPGATRDGVLNTNNWIESAFKVFKSVFLGGRKNRRWAALSTLAGIDRLIAVLINDYFPYYSMWPVNEPRPSAEVLAVQEQGYELWKGAVFRRQDNDTTTKWSVYYKKEWVVAVSNQPSELKYPPSDSPMGAACQDWKT